jgi:hypothetical protein
LAKSTTSENIVAFYFGGRPAGDSISIDALMAKLSKADSSQRLFYFEVFRTHMTKYTDSLSMNNVAVHTMNMLTYHTAYVLEFLTTYPDPACQQLFERASNHAFENMSWFFPSRAQFKRDLFNDLNASHRQQLDKLLK